MTTTKRLRAVKTNETAPKVEKKQTVAEAAAAGSHLDLLVAMQERIARTVSNPDCPPRDLASLTRRLQDISKEIEQLKLRMKQEAAEGGLEADVAEERGSAEQDRRVGDQFRGRRKVELARGGQVDRKNGPRDWDGQQQADEANGGLVARLADQVADDEVLAATQEHGDDENAQRGSEDEEDGGRQTSRAQGHNDVRVCPQRSATQVPRGKIGRAHV